MERFPFVFSLREAVGDRIGNRRVMRKSSMAAINLYVFNRGRRPLDTRLRRADSIGAAKDCRRRYRGRVRDRSPEQDIRLVNALAADNLVQAPGIGRFWATRERASECDD